MRTEQPTVCFVPPQNLSLSRVRKTSLSPPQQFITGRSNVVILLWFSVACFWCQSLGDVSPYVCSYYFSSVSVSAWPPFKK